MLVNIQNSQMDVVNQLGAYRKLVVIGLNPHFRLVRLSFKRTTTPIPTVV